MPLHTQYTISAALCLLFVGSLVLLESDFLSSLTMPKWFYFLCGLVLAFYAGFVYNTLYTSKLERLLALCLSDSTGNPVIIDNEIYLCSIYKIGEKVGH